MPVRLRPASFAVVLGAVLAAPLLPALGPTATATLDSVVRALPLPALTGAARTQTVPLAATDRLVGVTWRTGHPRVAVRWHTGAGWSVWAVADDDSTAPTPAERARATPGTEPLWRPPGADRAQVRLTGTGGGLTLVRVADAVRGVTHRLFGLPAAQAADARPLLGHVYSRADWGADESLRRHGPEYAGTVRAVVVHHTAQRNDYAPGDVPAMIRADYAYHVRTRGWNDIGYNLLVDRFGRIWQGRYGGIDRPVIGAQAEGFNTGTLGVAVLGDLSSAAPTTATLTALERVAAFAGAQWGFDPRGSVVLTSAGSPRYPAGQRVRLPRVMGHRDTGLTTCPGQQLYDRLGTIRAGGFGLLGPAPRWASGHLAGNPLAAPGPATITATADRTVAWTVVIAGPDGRHVAEATGTGRTARLSWDGMRSVLDAAGLAVRLPVPAGTYRFEASATDGVHTARPVYRGTLTVRAPTLGVLGRIVR